MKYILEKIQREPALLVGLAGAVIAVLVSFNVALTQGQQAAIIGLVIAVGAIIVRQSVTPNVSVGAKQDDLDPGLVAGPASVVPTGEPVDVIPALGEDLDLPDERGAFDTGILVALACIVIIICGIVWLIQALG